MKKISLLLSMVAAFSVASGQMKEGKVVYERTMQIRFQIRNADPELENAIPKTQVSSFELLFGNNQSLMQSLPDVNQEAGRMHTSEGPGGARVVQIMQFGGDDVTYVNLDTRKRITEREFNSKKYTIEDSITVLNWKMTGEAKVILGYKAFRATAQSIQKRSRMMMENGEMKRVEVQDTSNIVAWFTPDITVQTGPSYQGQLPGLILELDINNGRIVYKAVEVSPKVSLAAIREPKGGKRMTQEAFAKEMEKLLEERRRTMSERGGRITIETQQ